MTDRQRSPDDLQAEVAETLEAPPSLLPVLPELLQDLPDLSGSRDDVITLLRRARLPSGATVLDLGCGRGEIALAVAEAFDARVIGIDAFAPFVAAALRSAEEKQLADRCTFRHGDLRSALSAQEGYDAVLMIALGPVLGEPEETIGALRRVVRPGGVMVIDDGYLEPGAAPPAGSEYYRDLATTENALTRHSDVIEARLDGASGTAAFNAMALAAIRRRAAALARSRPELAADIERYVDRQVHEMQILEEVIVPAIWLLRRTADDR